jgi:hypothetical protein
MTWYRRSVAIFSLTFVVLGFVLLVKTAFIGGGSTGYLVGALFVALGTGRLYLLRQR